MSDGRSITCGDCNAPDPEWASLNRGLLLCKECCYIHRTLGPQFTRIKSIQHSKWHPNLKKMLYTLASGPANHVWEYTLLIEPSKADLNMKPSPKDPVETKKRKFIIAKHLYCQFVHRQKSDSLSNELHSTVRTADIGTSLRLLASGGDPNFFHPVQGTRPLHVAARHGQGLQVELLFVHGAQTDGLDYLGQTPVEHAMAAGHKDLALRLLELRYYLTDRLSYFVCSQVPDHSTTKHILIPKQNLIGQNHTAQEQMLRKQQSRVLEQFASDLFDEVDRRELESAMIGSTTGIEAAKYSVAFLPVHSYFPSVRNQTRQKFARLTNDELASIITLILIESKRRHCNTVALDISAEKDIFLHSDTESSISSGKSILDGPNKKRVVEDDEFPLYDNVASDDDLILTEEQTLLSPQRSTIETSSISSSNVNAISKCDSAEDQRLSAKLAESENVIRELQDQNEKMKIDIAVLQEMVAHVIKENVELRKEAGKNVADASPISPILLNGHSGLRNNSLSSLKAKPPRPVSMCDNKIDKPDLIGVRSNSTELNLRRKQSPILSASDLVQETTKKVVELIKTLIGQAHGNDVCGIQFTCNRIHEETQHMAITLINDISEKESQEALEHVLFQVLKMKFEIATLTRESMSKGAHDSFEDRISPQNSDKSTDSLSSDLVQQVKQICFEVGAAMKKLVSITIPQY